jgi:hypothetical protein
MKVRPMGDELLNADETSITFQNSEKASKTVSTVVSNSQISASTLVTRL